MVESICGQDFAKAREVEENWTKYLVKLDKKGQETQSRRLIDFETCGCPTCALNRLIIFALTYFEKRASQSTCVTITHAWLVYDRIDRSNSTASHVGRVRPMLLLGPGGVAAGPAGPGER
jgi:hypothetical protein